MMRFHRTVHMRKKVEKKYSKIKLKARATPGRTASDHMAATQEETEGEPSQPPSLSSNRQGRDGDQRKRRNTQKDSTGTAKHLQWAGVWQCPGDQGAQVGRGALKVKGCHGREVTSLLLWETLRLKNRETWKYKDRPDQKMQLVSTT